VQGEARASVGEPADAHTACQSRLSFLFLQAPQAPIVTVGESTVAREALATLVALKIWGVPVVEAAGAIVANFSVSDVRHLARVTNQADAEAALALPVLEFLRGYAQLHAPMEYRLCTAKCSVGCPMEYLMPPAPMQSTAVGLSYSHRSAVRASSWSAGPLPRQWLVQDTPPPPLVWCPSRCKRATPWPLWCSCSRSPDCTMCTWWTLPAGRWAS
jgi:hypothetical protein